MYDDSYLGIKISAMVGGLQEKIVTLAIDSKDTLDEVHKYKLFIDELRAIIEKWTKII